MDVAKVGANSIIGVFEYTQYSKKSEFIKAIWSEAFPAPNNIAASGNGSVFVINDHDETAGMVQPFSLRSAHSI